MFPELHLSFLAIITLLIPSSLVAQNEEFCQANSKKGSHECPNTDDELLWFFLSLFAIIAWGALVRTILRARKSTMPYTVILMITGLVIGGGTHIAIQGVCSFWSKFTRIARVTPKIILHTFLPALIFESAYSMNVHIFRRSLTQIIILALPGMLMSVALTGFLCHNGFAESYNWDYPTSFMYGSIISATDPVAVVAILKELGTSVKISILIEGESLLNDGVAILLFEIFRQIVEEKEGIMKEVGLTILKISLGGPLFGYAVGKICSKCLSMIFNDAATEITITVFASYIVYWVGERLGISGVISVVVLGLKLSADSTSVSPEVRKMVHHFWEMVGYLANTVLFFMVGIIVSETAISQIHSEDWYNLIFLYLNLNVIRLAVLMVLMPWLTRSGYGIHWKDMVVCSWGGLRGAVGLCLALEVFYSTEFCEKNEDAVGPKFLFHTAGIVFLTLLINGTTCKALMDALRLTEVSSGRIQDMNNVVKQILVTRNRSILQQRHDRQTADVDWTVVESYTTIRDPYQAQRDKSQRQKKKESTYEPGTPTYAGIVDLHPSLHPSTLTILTPSFAEMRDKTNSSSGKEPRKGSKDQSEVSNEGVSQSNMDVAVEMTPEEITEELRVMAEESRQRLLKALRVSFWRQYELGLLSDFAIQVLGGIADKVTDERLVMIHAKDLQEWYGLHGFSKWFHDYVIKRMHFDADPELPARPHQKWRMPFWTIASKDWFTAIITVVVLLNMIPAIWELYREIRKVHNDTRYAIGFLVTSFIFTLIYFVEFIIKFIGFGLIGYFKSKWNWLDSAVLLVAIIDVSFTFAALYQDATNVTISASSAFANFTRVFRILRISRSLRLLKCCVPPCNRYIDSKISEGIFYGYDIGKGFVSAVDDVIKFLPQMADHPKILHQLDRVLRKERLETIRLLGLLEYNHPGIATAVKTRHASRAVLNQLREALFDLKENGLLDKNEAGTLLGVLEKQMKNLWFTPAIVMPNSYSVTFSNLVWLDGADDQLHEYIKKYSKLVDFKEGEHISEVGDPPSGLYVIVKGIVKAHYLPTLYIVDERNSRGQLPNVEVVGDMSFCYEETDYLRPGYVIGEIGLLTKLSSACDLKCETDVTAYHIPTSKMESALKYFSDTDDSLESRIWRSIGMRIAVAILAKEPEYQPWSLEKIKVFVERSAVPIGQKYENMVLPEFTCDLILLQGQIMDGHSKEVFTAPQLIPRTCRKLEKVVNSETPARFLVIADEEMDGIDNEEDDNYEGFDIRRSIHSQLWKASRLNVDPNNENAYQRKSTAFQDFMRHHFKNA